jgi:hypothetical protein
MIIVTENTIPVACYDDVSPQEALHAYISKFLPSSNLSDILNSREEVPSFEWKKKIYNAVIYLESF